MGERRICTNRRQPQKPPPGDPCVFLLSGPEFGQSCIKGVRDNEVCRPQAPTDRTWIGGQPCPGSVLFIGVKLGYGGYRQDRACDPGLGLLLHSIERGLIDTEGAGSCNILRQHKQQNRPFFKKHGSDFELKRVAFIRCWANMVFPG